VTAEKRTVSEQKAPEAVTVVSGSQLTDLGATDIRTVELLSPSTRFAYESNVAQQFIRGIGDDLDFAWVPDSVSLNVNGAQITRFASLSSLYDIDTIQVLPGPQGTLYGGSASGGVINVTTKRPTATPESSALVDVGNFGSVVATLVENVPINDAFQVRAAININRHDGYQSNGSDDDDAVSGRLSAIYNPNDTLSVFVWTGLYEDRNQPAQPWIITPNNPHPWFVPLVGPPFSVPALGVSYPGNDLTVGHGDYHAFMAGGQVDVRFPGFTLTYLPSTVIYSDQDLRLIGGFEQVSHIDIHTYAQELRLTSDSDSLLRWIGGLYWRQNNTFNSNVFGPFLSGASVPDNNTNYSAYGQGTYSLTDAWRLTLGGRFSRDSTTADDASAVYPYCATIPCAGGHFLEGELPFSFSHSWNRFDWKVGTEFDIGAKSLLYATVQTGYNAGTFNPTPSTPKFNNLVDPQTLVSYTVGVKNRFFNDRLQINDELYDYEYKDLILEAFNAATGAETYFNAPKSRIYGNELTARWLVTAADEINLGIGLLHARLIDFADEGVNYAGAELMFSPEVTATLGLHHTEHLPSGGKVTGDITTQYENGYYAGDSFAHAANPELFQHAFTTTTAAIVYHAVSGKWSVGLWGKNLENHGVFGAGGAVSPGVGAAFIEPPRTYGLRFQLNQ
jgi:iron complex outermembrane receptor protein